MLLHLGCSSTQPTPEVVLEPLPVQFGATDLRWLQLLPEHHPSSQPDSPIVPNSNPLIHTITTAGETLIAIARWYTGDANNWHQLALVNADLDPQRMKIGATVMIPEQILITRELMPKRLKPVQHTQSPTPVTVQAPDRSSTPELFGPIDNPWSSDIQNTVLPRPLQRLDEFE